jgi:glyoxylate carboligase
MTDSPVPIIPFAGDFIASDDQRLFAFIDSLRKSVVEKVAAGQRRGLSLSEIVVEVREMVRFAEEDPDLPTPFPSHASKAISRQAVAWCIEAYQPLVFTGGHELVADAATQPTQLPLN